MTSRTAPVCSEETLGFCLLPIEQVRCPYGRLRPGAPRVPRDGLRELPLRVAPAEEPGVYEVVDGHKRLERWRGEGRRHVPVVVEPALSRPELERLLLAANAPPRTITALDEARVVCSLVDEDGKTQAQVARLLGRRPSWVGRRLAFGHRLSPEAEDRLARGRIGPTLAHALTASSLLAPGLPWRSTRSCPLTNQRSPRSTPSPLSPSPFRDHAARRPFGASVTAGAARCRRAPRSSSSRPLRP